MKIVFAIEYFFPFDKGGSEWSTYYLAKGLVKKGHNVTIVTPNYGSKSAESINGINLIRFPFYKKTRVFDKIPGNFFYTNPFFILWTALFLILALKKEKPDIIHVQGKYSISPARIANIYLKRPILTTIRDYIPICNYGMCLMQKDKACSLIEYFAKDFRKYFKQYVFPKNISNYALNLLMSIWGRMSSKLLKIVSRDLKVIVLSKRQENIYLANGYKNLQVMYNSFEFPKKIKNLKKEKVISYAGRLTPGKGINLIMDFIPEFTKEYSVYKFYFAGEGFLKENLIKLSKKYKQINVLGNISHKELLHLFAKSKAVLAPSVWPEPFGRVVLEALAANTPILVGKRNGLAPLISSKKWGVAAKSSPEDTMVKLKTLISDNEKFIERINKDYSQIKKMFSSDVIDKHINLYNSLFK